MKSTPKNIILDIGKVLVDFRWKEYINELGLNEETEKKLRRATVQNVKHWDEHDRGVLSDEEFIRESLNVVPGLEAELRLFFERIGEIVEEYDYAADWIMALKEKGYRVYLLSNYGKTTFEFAKKKLRFLKHVDGMVISSEVGYVKPEPQIYQCLLQKYALVPEECIFLDDREDNVVAARELGFHAIVFHSLEQANRDLKEYGIILV